MTRYYNGDIATQAGISKDNFSHWLNNSNLPKTDKALGQWEAKLREWSTAAREKLAQGRTDELPKARAVAAVDAGGGRGRGGRGGKGGRGRGRGRGGGAKAKAKAEEEDDGQDDYDNANESEGDGDHRIEAVLKEMRQGGSRWVLVKWQTFQPWENTWEPKKNLHAEMAEDFEWRRLLPFYLSELVELPPHAPPTMLKALHMAPVRQVVPEGEEEEGEEDDDDEEDEEVKEEVKEEEGGGAWRGEAGGEWRGGGGGDGGGAGGGQRRRVGDCLRRDRAAGRRGGGRGERCGGGRDPRSRRARCGVGRGR